MVTDSLLPNSLYLIEKVHVLNAGLICVSTKHTASAWSLDVMCLRSLYFQDVEQCPMPGGSLLTFSNMMRNEVSCFKDSLLLHVLILLFFFEIALLFGH